MKVERVKKEFEPVCITLETPEEDMRLRACLAIATYQYQAFPEHAKFANKLCNELKGANDLSKMNLDLKP